MGFRDFDPSTIALSLKPLLIELDQRASLTSRQFSHFIRTHQSTLGRSFSKDQLIAVHRYLQTHDPSYQVRDTLLTKLALKPVRTLSGVTPVTVLTKPFPCPGKCIFCPNDIRMPKSYLHDEPGAQRAERNQFDPYLQTMSRLRAFHNIGHLTEKIEIIILGGTWSFYPESYQIWFVKRCFDALNDFSVGVDHCEAVEALYAKKHAQHDIEAAQKDREILGKHLKKTYNQVISEIYTAPEKLLQLDHDQSASWNELFHAHTVNETARARCVGLVIETRPDNISEGEVIRIRKLGCTKTQIGFQSLQDDVLTKNHRGHDVEATRNAVRLLRLGGLKIHAHWMPNLYGSTPENDIADYKKMFADGDFMPDELKIYPCSLIESAELMQYYQDGRWQPYTYDELLHVLSACFQLTPEYCRLTRVIRDIPSTDIVVGNKKTNFREITERELAKLGVRSKDIRSREIRNAVVTVDALHLDEVRYQTSVSTEIFLQYITDSRQIAGFLRLSLPTVDPFIEELHDSAMIREVHVYGNTVAISKDEVPDTRSRLHEIGFRDDNTVLEHVQHLGLGKKLIARAKEIAMAQGFKKLQVISAVGTREYYRKQGFQDGELYQYVEL